MPTEKQQAMIWLNTTFGSKIEAEVRGTPLSKALVIAIAIQETYYVWRKLYKTATPGDVLAACVGDSIGAPRRRAFPKDRAELEAAANGKAMFKLARAELEKLAKTNTGYAAAAKDPNKFCRGYGLFQYDLQFFKVDPAYFLEAKWKSWEGTCGKCIGELMSKAKAPNLKYDKKASLTREESVYLAIAYNKGSVKTDISDPKARFKQGHKDRDGVFYGEHIAANLDAAKGLW